MQLPGFPFTCEEVSRGALSQNVRWRVVGPCSDRSPSLLTGTGKAGQPVTTDFSTTSAIVFVREKVDLAPVCGILVAVLVHIPVFIKTYITTRASGTRTVHVGIG